MEGKPGKDQNEKKRAKIDSLEAKFLRASAKIKDFDSRFQWIINFEALEHLQAAASRFKQLQNQAAASDMKSVWYIIYTVLQFTVLFT